MVHQRESIYFPNLNALRFVAALLVLMSHIEWMKFACGASDFNPAQSIFMAFLFNSGALGVNLFFTLSGFLITYLLLAEQGKTGTIHVGQFYCRRILRIWPLYYLTVFLGFAVLPHLLSIPIQNFPLYDGAYWKKLGLFVFMMPNVAYVVYPIVPFASQLWTVGVEEQFYFTWPLLIRLFNRSFLPMLVAIVVATVGLRQIILHQYVISRSQFWYLPYVLIDHLRIQCMAIGGIGAWAVFHRRQRLLKVIYARWFQILVLVMAAGIHLTLIDCFGAFRFEVLAILHTLIIVNAATNPSNLLRLENFLTNFLGRISYGIYIYQALALRLSFILVERYIGFSRGYWGNIALSVLGLGLTIALASASYYLFEVRFLRLKSRFSAILSNQLSADYGAGTKP